MESIKELAQTKKKLCELTDEELNQFLDTNEDQPSYVLACVCSEILRRQKNNKTINQ